MPTATQTVQRYARLANALRVLCADMVQQARSGHPGAPLGMADIATVLWLEHLRFNPANLQWPNRDRFVLSNGHASALLYALLHLSGSALTIEDLRQFRQLHSRTPGHPERGYTQGVEVTTGPLGQGLANGVGMALAERALAARFNRPDYPLVDHRTYVFAGDGCMMEGISHEACSFAASQRLGKLTVFYDDNDISIDGQASLWLGEDVGKRFEAYGWQVQRIDGHDLEAIHQAIVRAKQDSQRPSLICCKTMIGKGCVEKMNTAAAHGAPLGEAGVQSLRESCQWNEPPFEIPQPIYEQWNCVKKGTRWEQKWLSLHDFYRQKHSECAAEYQRVSASKLPQQWEQYKQELLDDAVSANEAMATRSASLYVLNRLGAQIPELVGGSADLTASNLTRWDEAVALTAQSPQGNYLYYGVRELAMTAIQNGIYAHGGLRPFTGTFLVFHDYAKSAVRLASMMKLGCIFVYTHDSIAVGEDGPTHQPVEQLSALRTLPGLYTWRPCDLVETAQAWVDALERKDAPSALLLSRQKLTALFRDSAQVNAIRQGAYVLDDEKRFELIILASGSEVSLAIAVAEALRQQHYKVRVVSVPCLELFEQQEAAYQESVIPPSCKARVAIEMSAGRDWDRWVGKEGIVFQQSCFGASGPYEEVLKSFGFSVERMVDACLLQLKALGQAQDKENMDD